MHVTEFRKILVDIDTVVALGKECPPKLLVVTEGLNYSAGSAFGLTQFIHTLASSPIHGMTPQIVKASRGADPNADIQHFDFTNATNGLLKSRYDGACLFGSDTEGAGQRPPAQVDAIARCMQAGGGPDRDLPSPTPYRRSTMKHLIGIAFAFALTLAILPARVSAQGQHIPIVSFATTPRTPVGGPVVIETTTPSARAQAPGQVKQGAAAHPSARDQAPGQGKQEEAALDENEDDPVATSGSPTSPDDLIWDIGGPGAL
jgi:hypothetical protein